jgi:cytochrome c biogenesis protein CcdA
MILFFLSLLAGVLTVLAPCTISLLPVIVGGSLSGKRSFARALVITASLGVSVILFTLLLKASTALVTIPQSFWQGLSGLVIIALGIVTIFPALYESLPVVNTLNRGSNRLLAVGYQKQNWTGDVLMGAALGPVFSSCSPTYFLILATVVPRSFSLGFVYLLAYAVGLCGALLVVTVAGQKLLEAFGVASDPSGWFKRAVGVLFILVGVAIFFGYDKKLELALASSAFDVTTIEQALLQRRDASGATPAPAPASATSSAAAPLQKVAPEKTPKDDATRIAAKRTRYQRAPEIANPSGFVNTGGAPITLGQFKGKKVVRRLLTSSVPLPPVSGTPPPVTAVPPASVTVKPPAPRPLVSWNTMCWLPRMPAVLHVAVQTAAGDAAESGHRLSLLMASRIFCAAVVVVSDAEKRTVYDLPATRKTYVPAAGVPATVNVIAAATAPPAAVGAAILSRTPGMRSASYAMHASSEPAPA